MGVRDADAPRIAAAFEAELRRLAGEGGPGEIRVALYVAHEFYNRWALDYGHYEYIWIPRYGANTGRIEDSIRPGHPCDLWQYTSRGRLPGIRGDVDIDVLNGPKPMGFFTGKDREEDNMATVYVYGASIDENGRAHGGQAGNQTGRELRKQKWYKHVKGWRVFRAKDAGMAAKIAQCAKAAVANRHIGYDQYERNTLYNEAAQFAWDVSKVTKDVECDCSALVRVCCAFAGITDLPEGFRTGNMPKNLLKTGAFTELTGTRYTDTYTYLRAGDILVTATSGHTVVVGNDGPKAEAQAPAAEGLSRSDYGSAVEAMQKLLLKWDAACLPKCGADGDFGKETEKALMAFQKAAGLPVTGVYDEATRAALTGAKPVQEQERPEGAEGASAAQQDAPETHDPAKAEGVGRIVLVTGGTVNVRNAPGTSGTRILSTVKRGDRLPYRGESRDISGTTWHLIIYKNQNAWISGNLSRVANA